MSDTPITDQLTGGYETFGPMIDSLVQHARAMEIKCAELKADHAILLATYNKVLMAWEMAKAELTTTRIENERLMKDVEGFKYLMCLHCAKVDSIQAKLATARKALKELIICACTVGAGNVDDRQTTRQADCPYAGA